MTDSCSPAAQLVDALTTRDFAQLEDCFAPSATMRALLPRGAVEFHGVDEIVGAFRLWFGAASGFEVLNTSVGDVAGRPHASWRLRVHPTPKGDDRWHIIEQQTFTDAGARINSLDLLCSGFIPDVATGTRRGNSGRGRDRL